MIIQMIPLMIPAVFLVAVFAALLLETAFKKTTYARMTGNGYFETIYDRGKYGEYLVYKELKMYERDGGKFLFNCYLPKDDGGTSEIDVLLIHSSGLFVIESKNYSGWIFGSETNRTWTQTLRSGRGKVVKEHFYNPIMQNQTHIKWLRSQVGKNIPVYSVIAFSERCTLKDITVESPDIKVINRQAVSGAVKYLGNQSLLALSKMDIVRIYEMLYSYTQTTEYEKQQHIENIYATKRSGGKKSAVQPVVQFVGSGQAETADDTMTSPQNKKICPRCGAEIVLRTAKKGEHAGEQFYGCSGFPKCRYHEYIKNDS